MKFSPSDTKKIIEMMNAGKPGSSIMEQFGIQDSDFLYEIRYAFPDKIRHFDSPYFVARQYIFPTFNYGDRIIENMKLLFKTENSDKIYKVIEHGCGNGSYAKKVAESVSNINILGVELTQTGVQAAKRFENDRLHFLQADGYEITGKGEYDCVYHVNVLEHVSDGIKYLEKGLSLLSDDGHLIFSCPTKGSWYLWGFAKWITCLIIGREFETHSFDENAVKKFVQTKD